MTCVILPEALYRETLGIGESLLCLGLRLHFLVVLERVEAGGRVNSNWLSSIDSFRRLKITCGNENSITCHLNIVQI